MKTFTQKILLVAIIISFWGITQAQVPATYYDSANGLTGAALKTELYNIIKNPSVTSYTGLWTAFQTTDVDGVYENDGSVLDIYSENPTTTDPYNFVFVTDQDNGTNVAEGVHYNREHSFPKAWFGSASPMYSDLFHIYPTDKIVNGERSNYPYGENNGELFTSGNGSKLGACTTAGYTGTVFEPIDEFKGDVARSYFYMATCYENVISGWSSVILDGSTFQCFETWQLDMLIAWHQADPVSQKEIDRNNAIYNIQGNANPFISHPEYVCQIWGGSSCTTTPTVSSSSSTISGISYVEGTGPSAPATFNVYGSNLTGTSLTLTAPTNYEISLAETGTYGSSLDISYTLPTLSSTPVYVRLKAGLPVSTYPSETISISDNGAKGPSSNVTVNGEVTGAATATTTCEDFNTTSGTSYVTSFTVPTGTWTGLSTGNFDLGTPHEGASCVLINDDTPGGQLTTPNLNTCGTVSFWHYNRSGISSDVFKLQISENGGGYTDLETYNYGPNTAYTYYEYVVNSSAPQVNIRILNDDQKGHLVIDDFCWTNYSASSGPAAPTAFTEACATEAGINLTWTKPAGTHATDWDGVVVFARATTANDADPTDNDATDFIADTYYGSGTQDGNSFCVANQTTDADGNITVTGLTAGTTYKFVAYTYLNDGSPDTWSTATSEVSVVATTIEDVSGATTTQGDTQLTLDWTNPTMTCYDNVIIVAREGAAVEAAVSKDTLDGFAGDEDFTANAAFPTGSDVFDITGAGTNNTNYVVYKGSGTTATITGLTNGVTYHFKIFVTDQTAAGDRWSSGVETSGTPAVDPCSISETIPYSEGFENGGTIANCWTEAIVNDPGADPALSYVTSSTNPTVATADEGSYFVKFNSYSCPDDAQIRLQSKKITSVGKSNLEVLFAWYEDDGYSTALNEEVTVQWSTDKTTWNNVSTFDRYNATTGWKDKAISLPAGAENQAELYIGFLFNSDYGNNCSFDDFVIREATPASTVLADNGTQITAADVSQGTTKHTIHTFTLTVSNSATELSQLDFTTGGTIDADDIDQLQLWYNTTNDLSAATAIKSIATPGVAGTESFATIAQALGTGTHYFWITADVNASATVNNTISCTAFDNTALTFTTGSKSGSTTAGADQTIIAYVAPVVFISEIASDGNDGNYQDEYIEISNNGAVGADLTGWHLEYYNSSDVKEGNVTLTGTLAAGDAWVIAARSSGWITISPDFNGNFSMNSYCYVKLVDNSATLIDEAGTATSDEFSENNFEFTDCTNDNLPVANWDDNGTTNGTPGVINCIAVGPPSNITIADNGTQVGASTELINATNVILHQSQITAADEDATLTGITCTTVGSYFASDISNLKVYYSTDATFDGGDAILSTQASPTTAGAQTFPSFTSQLIATGATGYIFITADLSGSAVGGRNINVNALTTADYTFTNANKAGSTTNGGVKTFYDADVVVTQNGSVAAANVSPGQTSLVLSSWDLTSNAGAATLNQAVMTVTGTYAAADIAANGYKLWSSATNDFATATQVGSSVSAAGGGVQSITFSGLSEAISDGGTVYFWFTVDIATAAAPGHTIQRTTTLGSDFSYDENVHKSGSYGTEGLQTIAIPTIVVADNGTQVTAANVPQGTASHIVSTFKIDVTNSNATLTDADIYFDGSYLAGDIVASGFKLWYNSADDFSTATSLNSQTAVGSGGSGEIISFTGFSQNILQNTTGYFWVTADISAGATPNNTIQTLAVDNTDLTFVAANKSGSASIAGVQTIIEVLGTADDIIISEMCDPTDDYVTDRYIEIYNPTSDVIDLTGCKVIAIANGSDSYFTWNLSGTIDPCEALVCGDDGATTFTPDFIASTWSSNNTSWNGNSTDGAFFENSTGTKIDYAKVTTDIFENATVIRNSNISVPNTTYTSSEWTATTVTTANTGASNPGIHVNDGCAIVCEEPTANATTMTFSSITGNSMTVGWTSGNGLNRIVVAKEGSAVDWTPTDLATYVANASFGSGTEMGTGNYIIYNGNGTSVNVTNLTGGTTYYFAVFEYGCLPGNEDYLITGYLTGNGTTLRELTTLNTIPSELCISANCGNDFIVDFTYSPVTDFVGTFTIQLSNASGSFATPTDITSIGADGTGAQSVLASIPNTTPVGSGYRIRVTSSDPVQDGTDNGTDITIAVGPSDITSLYAVPWSGEVELDWINPTSCYEEVIVVASTSTIAGTPSGTYTVNSNSFSDGLNPTIAAGEVVVYSGTGNNVIVTGLTDGTPYFFKVFVRTCVDWSAGVEISKTPTEFTKLKAGDLMVIGFDDYINIVGEVGTDRVSLVNLVPLKPNTSFDYVNAVYEWDEPANVRSGKWYNCATDPDADYFTVQRVTYTGTVDLPAGSIICIEIPVSDAVFSNFSLNGNVTTDFSAAEVPGYELKTRVNISKTEPDAIFITQGEWQQFITPNYSILHGNVIAGMQEGGSWYKVSDATNNLPANGSENRISRIPPDIECFRIQGSTSVGQYYTYYSGAIKTGSQLSLISEIIDYAHNWTDGNTDGDDLAALTCNNAYGTFTVTGSVNEGIWTGAVSTDWFDCSNWENFQVPDASINVTIPNGASRNSEVDLTGTTPGTDKTQYADLYENIARCKNINVENGMTLSVDETNDNMEVYGNFNLELNATLDMNDGVGANTDGTLNIFGNWNNLSGGANFDEGTGTVNFKGSIAQELTSTDATENFYNLTIANSSSGLLLNNSVVVANELTQTSGNIDLNGKDIEMQGTYARTNGMFIGDAASNMEINNAGTIADIYFTTDYNLNNFTMNRNAETATLMTDLFVGNLFTITAGQVVMTAGNDYDANTLINSVGTNGLTLKSNGTGTASLIHNSNPNTNAMALCERYLPANQWHYVFSPLSDVDRTDLSQTLGAVENPNFYYYDEPIADFWKGLEIFNPTGWTNEAATKLSVAKGYIHQSPEARIYELDGGNLNDDDKDFTLSYTNSGSGAASPGLPNEIDTDWDEFEGWNFIGNPYPSALNWDNIWTNIVTNGQNSYLENGVYYYDPTQSKYVFYGLAGDFNNIGITLNGSGTANYANIPANQGFFVKATPAGHGQTITIPKTARLHSSQAFWKGAQPQNPNMLKLNIAQGEFTDEMIVRTLPIESEVTEGHDGNYDAYKMFSWDANKPQIFTKSDANDRYFAVNSLPEFVGHKVVPVGIYVGTAGEYTINLTENTFENTHVWLEDKTNNTFTSFNTNSTYEFTQAVEDNNDRFFLHFELNHAPNASVELMNQTIYVNTDFYFELPANSFYDVDMFDELTISTLNLPEWLTFENGQLSGSTKKVGQYPVNFVATDMFGEKAQNGFIINVIEKATDIIDLENNISLYPNPTTGIVSVKFANAVNGKLSILNITGQTMSEMNINSKNIQLDLSKYAKGVYIINVESDNQIYREKIILE